MRITEAHYTNITPMEDRLEACKAALEICLSEIIDDPPPVQAFYRSVRFGLGNVEFTIEFDKPYCQVTKAEDSEIHYVYDDGVMAYRIKKATPNDLFTVETMEIATGQDWDDVVPEIVADIIRVWSIHECMKLRDEIPAPVGFQEIIN